MNVCAHPMTRSVRRVSVLLAALLSGCSLRWESAEDTGSPAHAEQVSYGEGAGMVVYTTAGLVRHDADLASRSAAIRLDNSMGELKDVPFSFSMADDGKVAAVAFSNTTERDVVLYDPGSFDELITLDVQTLRSFPVQGVALDPRGERVFVRGDFWAMYDVATGERLWGAAPEGECCGLEEPTFSADGAVLYGFEGTRLEARRAQTGDVIFSVESGSTPGKPVSLARSGSDGILVGARSMTSGGDPEVHEQYVFWSEADGRVVRELPQFVDRLLVGTFPGGGHVKCAPGGDVCASGLVIPESSRTLPPQYSVAVWTSEGELLHELPVFANGLAFSPDGARLAVAGGEAALYVVHDGSLVASVSYTYADF